MPITKSCISPPIEAGQSLLDAMQLPPQFTNALEYVSSRLARKRLHLSLIVVRKDVQIPGSPFAQCPQSPATFKRSASKSSLSSVSSSSSTSSTASVSRTIRPSLPTSPNPFGVSLMHASTLTEKAERILQHTVAKAEKKFSIGSGWLSSQPLPTLQASSTNDLIRRSLIQNEVIFSSEGLTLLSLDHVYTFKSQLHTYSRSLAPSDLTCAVDELRRLVLAQGGRRVTKGYLMRAYDWLGISLSALVDVNEGYKFAYGGSQRFGGIEVQNEERRTPPPLNTFFATRDLKLMNTYVAYEDQSSEGTSSLGSASQEESVVSRWREDRGPHLRGPATPNGFEDLTPVTQEEWSFLINSDSWNGARTVAIETC
ncbi:uncharacterized protein LY89DRAFT_612453 [Mollisia scopiformis]|uniref:DUF7582 domain-containing protein n=1 Tax=Mollisia scopiformis TaxID=149040 RepID=A0A194XFT6_MOLSC|nr:uncharacterized protein LY89DRAFT_612453 [Mollisia scopiformis]KUJ19033.1 hypothetical protein LY89DRAFT_612453 [Mollisia scopiformis]